VLYQIWETSIYAIGGKQYHQRAAAVWCDQHSRISDGSAGSHGGRVTTPNSSRLVAAGPAEWLASGAGI
jgi:hypothetical protein